MCISAKKSQGGVSKPCLSYPVFQCLFCFKLFSKLKFIDRFSSVAQSCLTLGDPMDCNMPGFPIFYQFLELTQIHGHPVSDAIQPSYPLSSSSCPAFNLSQHQGLFKWVISSHQVANIGLSASTSVLPMDIQDWFPLGLTERISLQSKGLSRVFSNTQFNTINSSALSFLYTPTLTSIHDYWKNHSFD